MKTDHFSKYMLYGILVLLFVPVQVSWAKNKKTPVEKNTSYKVAVCDWMILKRQKIGAFQLAKELGSDGLELDMGSLGRRDSFDNKLREPSFQKLFKDKAAEYDVEISSIAMSGFYGQSFLGRQNYIDLLRDCLNTMKAMNVKIAFLPLGVGCDLKKNPEIRPELVKRLSAAGKMARQANVVIGIETSLSAKEEVELLKDIDSPAIKIYFKFQNALEAGRDLYQEMRILGKERICQIHCTDTDGVTLPYNTRIDMDQVKKTLDELKWKGWLVVERSRNQDDVRNVKKNFSENVEYLKNKFQK